MLRLRLTYGGWVVGASLVTLVSIQQTMHLGAQEAGALFTRAAPQQSDRQAKQRVLAEIRSRRVGIDVSRLPDRVDADRPDRLVLNLFDDVELVAEIDRIESQDERSKTYVGHVEALPNHVDRRDDNSVTLVVSDGVMIGSINTPTASYQIRFDGTNHVIRQVDPVAFPPELDPTPTATLPFVPDDDSVASDDGSRVDVMVLYTAAARAAAGGTAAMQNLITLGVHETNEMYANSGIGTRMRLVHMREVFYAEAGNPQTDRDRLFDGADGFLDAVHAWRNTYGADMVQMLVNNAGRSCGVAYLNGPFSLMSAQSARAYAVTNWQCVSPNYSFAHEFGHIQGSNHAPEDPAGLGAFSYSLGFKRCSSQPAFRSVMSEACTTGATGTPRSKYYSNPSLVVSGQPIGTSTQNDALSLHNTRNVIANFRPEQPLVAITELWPPANQPFGKSTKLWAFVVNNGPYALRSARVWFWTDGPGNGTGEGWVGSAALAGLAPGAGAWYAFTFEIPMNANPGEWVYWARAHDSVAGEYLSNWQGPQAFTVLNAAADVFHYSHTPVIEPGQSATLSVVVRNTGNVAFPASTSVYFWMTGPGATNGYVGNVLLASVPVGGWDVYDFKWSIPVTQPVGRYTYRAMVWYQSGSGWRAISGWSPDQNVTVVAGSFGASIERLWYVVQPSGTAPKRGQPARLWAEALNTGRNAHDADTFIYFWVRGPGLDGYVGRQTLDGLASGASAWKFYDWTIPAGAEPDAYSYWAIAWRYVGSTWFALSPFKGPQTFNVAADAVGVARTADPSPSIFRGTDAGITHSTPRARDR
jgi:peptidyl-Asp metalloendopeptidase